MASQILYRDRSKICEDCREPGVDYRYQGPLAPSGMTLYLCGRCLHLRAKYFKKHGQPKPLAENQPNSQYF